MTVKAIPLPEGCPALMPYLIARRASEAMAFYRQVFDAVEIMHLNAPDGSIGYAEIRIGDAVVMLSEENLAWSSQAPETLGGSPVTLFLYVSVVDSTFATVIQAGAREFMPVRNQFWVDRTGVLKNPFGHLWHIGSQIEDVDPADLQQRRIEACCSNPLGVSHEPYRH